MLRQVGILARGTILLLVLATPVEPATCRDPREQAFTPAGSFWMGSDTKERGLARSLSSPETVAADWFSAELARRRIETEAFCIDRLLITQGRYAEFVARTGHRVPGISRDEYLRQGFLVHDYEAEVIRYLWRDGRIFPWGDSWDPNRLNSATRGPLGTTPVGLYPTGASPYGLLDAVGNVFQWTVDIFPDGRRVLKGCSWDDDAGLCRPAARHARPGASRHILIGFRCREPASAP